MSSNENDSRPLLAPRATEPFPQQGQVDWAVLGKYTVEFTVDAISRLSKAGIEALTICAAKVIFNQVKLGEQRVIDALENTKAFPSYGEALWLGFGIKHIVRSLSESQQGIACIGICSCMTEEFSTSTSAKILRELFELYDPPAELRPSLRQWYALIQACEGVVASTNFGLILSELARICLLDGHRNIRTSSAPKNIAKVLKGLFDVSKGAVEKIYISGGADCAWLAAVAHWLLGLRVVIQDQSGDPVYRPGNLKSTTAQDSQVIIYYGTSKPETSALVQKSYVVPSGRLLVTNLDIPEDDILLHGRLNWSTCLCDTFGKQMKLLLKSFGPHTGACLGSAARIYEHLSCDSEQVLLSDEVYAYGNGIPGLFSFGRGSLIQARDMFPELRDAPDLLHAMEISQGRSPEAAVKEFSESINSLRTRCKCSVCTENPGGRKWIGNDDGKFCMVLLVYLLCNLIRLSSQIVFQKDLPIRPSLAGMERMYSHQKLPLSSGEEFDSIQILLRRWLPGETILGNAQILFTGRADEDFREQGMIGVSASAVHGLCIYSNSLCEIAINPERACSVYVVPGQIQWNGYLYSQVRDAKGHGLQVQNDSKWPSLSTSVITVYDNLNDSSTRDLESALVIEEEYPHSQSLVAKWRISSSKGFWLLGPQLINTALSDAYCGKTCQPRGCGSLNGFKSTLVEGEGLINSDQIGVDSQSPMYGPFIRVLSGNPMAVWVALAENRVELPTGRDIGLPAMLQGRQCIRCCIMGAIARFTQEDSRHPLGTVCILTSV